MMDPSPLRLTVVIPTHNRHEKVINTIACIQRQNLPGDQYEIIVVDDASNPPVTLPAEEGQAKVSLIRFDKSVERAVGRTTAAEAGRGELVLFLDNDLIVEPDFLEQHLKAHEDWPGALVIGKILLPPQALTHPGIRFRQALELTGVPDARGPVISRTFCTAANMSIRRTRYLEMGGFHTEMVPIEDQDFALRLTAEGGQIVFVPQALAIHDDEWLDFPRFCRRQQVSALHMVAFGRRYPELDITKDRARINGPIRWGLDGPSLAARKLLKSFLGSRPVQPLLFGFSEFLARVAPESRALDSLYRLLLGIHMQRGYRLGLQRFGSVS